MKQPDLFGGESEIVDGVKRGWLEVKRIRRYRLAIDKAVSCKTCEHCTYNEMANRYYKCLLMSTAASATSDIRLKNVCDLWQHTQSP